MPADGDILYKVLYFDLLDDRIQPRGGIAVLHASCGDAWAGGRVWGLEIDASDGDWQEQQTRSRHRHWAGTVNFGFSPFLCFCYFNINFVVLRTTIIYLWCW